MGYKLTNYYFVLYGKCFDLYGGKMTECLYHRMNNPPVNTVLKLVISAMSLLLTHIF